MTFELRDPAVTKRILEAASPQNFNYKEIYYLIKSQKALNITESIRTLTILSISAHGVDLYADLFHGWKVADATPLAFFHSKNGSVVIFRSDWTVQAHSSAKKDSVYVVSKAGVFEQLKAYLQ